MIEPFFLLAFAVLLAIIAVVGHGLWLIMAGLLRCLDGKSPSQAGFNCPRCGQINPPGGAQCYRCGRTLDPILAEELADLDATQRQVRRMQNTGYLKSSTAEKVLARLTRYRRERIGTRLPKSRETAADVGRSAASAPPAAPDGRSSDRNHRPPTATETPAFAPAIHPDAIHPDAIHPEVVHREVVPPEAVRPMAASAPAGPAQVPSHPEAPWQDAVAEFLAEREIHWAEMIGVLVGGFIMVGSSIALVVNLWQLLEQTPYLKFLIFVAYTSLVFAAGLYAFHRWKLRSTGGGLLTIGTLLVPLNFLAMASLWRSGLDFGAIAAEVVALMLFAGLVRLAAGVLMPDGRWLGPLAVAGNSAAILGMARFVHADQPAWLLAAAVYVPVVLFAGTMGTYLFRISRKPTLGESDAAALGLMLGTSVFAMCIPVGLYIAEALRCFGDLEAVLNLLAVPMALTAAPILATGLRLTHTTASTGLTGNRPASPALGSGTKPSPGDSAAASYHAGGMVVALLAVILGLAALGLAWPEPQSLVTVGLFNAAGLAFAAVRYRFPAAHAGVMICLACSYLISFHWAIGNLAEVTPPELEATLLHLAVSAQSGTALAGMFVAFVLASVMLANMRDPRHGQAYATGAAVVAVVGLMLVSYHGLADGARDAVRAAALYAVYGTGCCSLAGCRKDRGFAYLGVALWTVVPLWLLWMATNEIRPVAATLLAAEAIVAALLAGGVTRAKAALNVFNQPLRQVGKMLAILSLLVWLGTGLTHPDAIGGALSPVATIILLAVFFFQQAWRSEGGASTWFGSFVVLAGLTHSLVANFPGLVAEPWLIATLSHASCALFAALAIEAVAQRQTDLIRRRLVRVFVEPLANSGLLASMLLVLIVPLVWRTDWLFCLGLFWLGTIWLVYAVRNGSVSLFNAHLVAMSVAVVTGATIWLESRGFNLATDGLQPAYLHVYGISLTVTMLPWALLRLLRHRFDAGAGASEETSRTGYLIRLARNGNRLLAATPSVDIALRRGMIFLQLVLAILWLAPEVARELGLPVGPIENGAFAVGDGGAWLLFALLSGGLLVDLWHRCGKMELLGGLALLGVMPWLLASHGIGDVAVATMLRWTAAMGYLGLAVVLWRRAEIARLVHAPRLVHALGVAWEGAAVENRSSPLMPPDRLARIAMLVLGLLPVVGITVVAAMLRLEYVTPRGPLAESPFHALGYHTSYLVPLLFIAIALVGSALRERSGGYALASCLIASLAGVVSWQMPGPLDWHGLVLNQAVALAVSGGFWTMLKLALPDRVPPLPVGDVEVGPSHLAVLTAVGLMLLLTAASAMGDISGSYRVSVGPLEALCLLLVAAAVAFCLWDSSARFPLAAMYFLGLAAAGIWLGYRELGPREYLWNAAPEVGGVLIIAGILGWRFGRMGRVWRALGIPNDEDRWSTHWFHLCQAVLGVIVASLAFWVAFDVENDGVGIKTALFNLHGRRTGPSTSLILMGMTVAMAWQAQGSGRRIWQTAAFGAGFLLNLTIGLASLDATAGSPMAVAPWLNRCAVLVTGAAMLTLLTRVGFPRVLPRSGDWIGVSRDVTPVFGAITAMALPALLAGEVIRFHPANGAPLAMFSVIAIPVLLLLLAVACVVHAVQAARCRNARPAWDMLPSGVGNEPELSPQAFVYAAEAIVAMGALHLWLCQPQWFRLGLVEQYWMFLVMAAAFLGVGISEWFHRVKLSVLSEPLQNTALALPLIPMAGFWFMSPSESPFGLTGGTPALWLLMAVFYGVQAAMRPTSVLLGVLTLFTGSVGLWVLLDRQSLDFFTHPQLWLIPPALAMLVAERLERPLLGASQRETLRYTALSVVYVASTTEFLQGVGHSIWLPLTLLGLSVAGIFAGVAFRIRCYVYLGITFLGVVIVRMIGYAAFEQGQMWLFWACCILLGIAIFIVSAVFERRREVFIAAARKMRQWER